MATFSALRQTTFVAPVEGRDDSNLLEGLTIRRTNKPTDIIDDGSRVATIKKLQIIPTSNIGAAYGLYVESPTNEAASKTIGTVYSAFIDALTTSPTGTVTKSYALGVERPLYGGNISIQSKGDIQLGDDASPAATMALQTKASTTFNLLTTNTSDINFGSASGSIVIGKKDSAANTISIGAGENSSGAKSISIGTGATGGTTSVTIGSTSGSSATTVQIDGTITNAVWNAGIIPASKGGTGKNNSNTLTINNSTSAKSANNLTFTIPSAGATVSVPEGSISDTLLTDKSSATVTNKTLAFGTGGDNIFKITHDGTAGSLTTITGVTDGDSVLATKAYVDAVRTGLDVKSSVRAASTANVASLSGIPSNFDGLTGPTALVDGDRVLLKDQINKVNNGIWVVHSGAWTRPPDFCSASFTVSSFSSGATILTLATAATGTIEEGQYIFGTGIPAGAHVLAHGDGSIGSTIVISASTTGSSDGNEYKTTNVSTGAFVFVDGGTANNDSGWVLNTDTTYVNGMLFIGVDAIDWTKFSSAGSYTAASGGGLSIDGSGGFSIAASTEVKNWLAGATADNLYAALTTGTTGTTANVTGRNTSGDSVVYNNNPIINNGITATGTFAVADTATTLTVGAGSSSITIGGTRTGAQTINIGSGATSSTNTKDINIGTSGLSTSTTNVTIGSNLSLVNNTITLNAQSIKNPSATITMFSDNTTTSLSVVDQSGIATINIAGSSAVSLTQVNFATGVVSSAQTGNLFTGASGDSTYYFATGATATSKTKSISIGTGGNSGSVTEVTIGSSAGTAANYVTLQAGTGTSGTINLNAGTISSNRAGTVNLFNTTVTRLDIGGEATTVNFGSATGAGNAVTVNAGTAGTITLNGGTSTNNGAIVLTTGTGATANIALNSPLIDSSVSTVTFLKTPTNITVGQNSTGTSNAISILAGNIGGTITLGAGSSGGTINLNAGTIVSTYSTLDLFNTISTSLNFAGAATSIVMGSTSGTANSVTINAGASGNAATTINLNADTIASNRAGTVALFNTGVTGLNIGGAATAIALGSTSGTSNTVSLNAGASGGTISLNTGGGTINLNGGTIVSTSTTVNLLNATTTTINLGGAATTINLGPSDNSGVTNLYGALKGYIPTALGANTFPGGAAGTYRRTGMYILYGNTTNSTQARLTSAGSGVSASGSNIPVIPAGSAWFAKVFVTAYNSTSSEGASWEITTMYRRGSSGNVALVGDPFVTASSDANQGDYLQITVQEDTTNQGIDIRVQNTAPSNTHNVYWTAVVQTVEVG